MAKDDKLTFLEQLSNALVGQSATSGARALGEGIGYGFGGGALSDIPDVMREAIEEHKQRTANQSKNEQDALAVASGLAAMSNPYSAVGHAMDFVGAVPDMIKYKLSDGEAPIGTIAETGLKRRLQKGGPAADFAMANQLERAKANITARKNKSGYSIDPKLARREVEAFMPIESKNANWGPGEGKFQVIDDYETRAYDLARKGFDETNIGMGRYDAKVIEGHPHDLGVEFANTIGLAPQYRDKGYGKQIYQNMADVYGGGISHTGSTTKEARKIYERLGAIDTGIESGGGTRQALPTRAMKEDPEAMAAFQKKIDQYALPRGGKGKLPPIEVEDTGMGGEHEYLARKPDTSFSEYGATPSEAIDNLRANLPEAMRQRSPRQGQQSSTYSTVFDNPEIATREIGNRLLKLGHDKVQISGSAVNEIFGDWLNFRQQMKTQGFDAKYDTVTRLFDITRKP